MARREDLQLIQEGRRLMSLGDPEGAVLAFSQALDANAESVEAAWHLARAFAATESFTRAADTYRTVVELDERRSDAWIALGEALLTIDCIDDAIEALDQAASRSPRRPEPHVLRGRALLKAGFAEAALSSFRRVVSRDPDDVEAATGTAQALDLLRRDAEAASAWERVLTLQPDDRDARKARTNASARANEHTATLGAGSKSPNKATGPYRPHPREDRLFAWARALSTEGRVEESLTVLDEALELAPVRADLLRTRADGLRVLHRLEEAVAEYEAALQADPEDAWAARGLGLVLGDLGRTDTAVEAFDRAISIAPDESRTHSARADLLRSLERFDAALRGYDRALAIDGSSIEAMVGKAKALAAMGRYGAALPIWRSILRVMPNHPSALRGLKRCERELESNTNDTKERTAKGVARIHFDLGRAVLRQGRPRDAIPAFRMATEAHSEWGEPWLYLGIAHEKLGEDDDAHQAYTEALSREPEHVEAACRMGDLCRRIGDNTGAASAYATALDIDPRLVHGLAGRAEALRLLERTGEALEGFKAALRIDGEDFVALCGMAAALMAEGRYDEAKTCWTRARVVDADSVYVLKGLAQCDLASRDNLAPGSIVMPTVPSADRGSPDSRQRHKRQTAADELDRGRSFHKERNYAQAIRCYKRSLELDNSFAEAALRLGMAYEDDRQFRRAIAAYETCLRIEPDHFQASTNIGEAHRKNENYHEAIEAYDRALAVKPDYLYAIAGRAECLRMLGRYEESLRWFDKALDVGPNHCFAIQGKAAALNALHRFSEALPAWERALEIEPQSQFALEGKAFCEAQLRNGDRKDISSDEVVPIIESDTPTLDEQGRDLTALALEGKLPEVIGRDKEIRAVMKTLIRRLKANPLMLGEPGVGKTAVVEGVAQRLARGDAPERLRNVRIIELSMGTLVAGTKYRGTFEERLREIVKEAKSVPGLVLFIDEIHTLVGAGRTEGGSLDAANILKPALARGELTVIGATTHDEFRRHFESDSALERRFQPIFVDEPSAEDCITLLTAVRGTYEQHHAVEVSTDALRACVDMGIRYVPDRRLPDKALDLLDEACADASLNGDTIVDSETVAKVVSDRTGVPVRKLTDSDRARMSSIEDTLSGRVMGQQPAVNLVGNAIRLIRSGLRDGNRPRGVFLFCGASGVGKTELAKTLSDFLFPEGDALIRLDMSEYADRFTSTRLLGAPPGYSGHGEEGQLSGPLRRKPYSVVLLDEFEKAHEDVQSVFLSLFDEGVITDSEGRTVNAREAFFILTTNAGAGATGRKVGFGGKGRDRRGAMMDAVRPFFRPELLDRIDEIIPFEALEEDTLGDIVRLKLQSLRERAKGSGIDLSWDKDMPDWIVSRRDVKGEGARSAIRAIETTLAEPLGRMMIELASTDDRRLHAVVRDNEVHFEAVHETQNVPTPA